MEKILEVKNLTKKFKHIAVNNISYVEKGNVYGLLGPNGSGKSTTFGMFCLQSIQLPVAGNGLEKKEQIRTHSKESAPL